MKKRAAAIMAILSILCPSTSGAMDAPRRVISMNLCTDQLAMLIASQGQLHSVSYLSQQPDALLSERTRALAVNHGLAEEIFLMKPDLVLAGTFTTRATVSMLRRLGFRVEEFAPETSVDEVRANILRMGELLGRAPRAAQLARDLDAALAAPSPTGEKPRAALYFANSHTSGTGTLVGALVAEAGLANIADELGLAGTTRLPLEALVMARPDLIVTGDRDYGRPALAHENFVHPAFRHVAREDAIVQVANRLTVCGGPFNADAVRLLRQAAVGVRP